MEEQEQEKIDIENLIPRVLSGQELTALSKMAKQALQRTKSRQLQEKTRDSDYEPSINTKKPTQKDWMKLIYDDITEEFNLDKMEYGPNTLKLIKIISGIVKLQESKLLSLEFIDIVGLIFKIVERQKAGVENSFLKSWITNLAT